MLRTVTPAVGHAFTLVETHLLAGLAHLDLGDRSAAAAAAESALAAAEPDRLMLPVRHDGSRGAARRAPASPNRSRRPPGRHRRFAARQTDPEHRPGAPGASDELSPSELRVLRYLPTNLTRPEIARELYVSINTVNTHIRNIYSKLGARDRSSAVRRARELRLLSTGRS